MQKTLDLERAADAWTKVNKILENKDYDIDWKDKYAAYAESLPATILNCGLGQACATLLAASKKRDDGSLKDDPHYVLYKDLQNWLCRESPVAPYGEEDLMKAIISNDRWTYMHAQAEALKWLEWLKKLAVAYLKKTGAGER
jgi:CRISPR-associated protein Cmr5